MRAPSWCVSRKASGLLLFEASVTVAIVTVGLIWVVSSYSEVINKLRQATQVSRAARCLEARWAVWELAGQATAGTVAGECDEPVFRWSAEAVPAADPALTLATVQVEWDDRRRPRHLRLVSYLPAEPSGP